MDYIICRRQMSSLYVKQVECSMYDVLPSLTSKVGKLPRPWMAITSFMRSLSLRGWGDHDHDKRN